MSAMHAFAAVAALTLAGGAVAPAYAADAPEPVNVALASGPSAPTLDVSYDTSWNDSAALNDGETGPTDAYDEMWGTWGAPEDPDQDWATYTWDVPVTISSSTVYFWQNLGTPDGDGGIMIPQSWSLEYQDDAGQWQPVTGADLEYPVPTLDPDEPTASQPPVTATFDEVTTSAVRLNLQRTDHEGQLRATSVIEWEVFGQAAPPSEGEPEDPDAFIDAEQVSARTLVDTAPQLPEQVWVIDSGGPLHYVDVDWEPVDEAALSEPGTVTVTGDPSGYDGQSVTATVYVAESLSQEISSLEYAATITAPGVEPVLPRTVVAQYDDGTVSSTLGVEWEAIDPDQYAEAGALFDVTGTVEGYADDAIATVFVVEPVEQEKPIVSIDVGGNPQGSGWYTSPPTIAISAEATTSPVESVEYSLDGGQTWQEYTTAFELDAQGEVSLTARATAANGAVGTAEQALKVDSHAPETGIHFVIEEDDSATVTLNATDAEPGSGVTRTVWSDGPDADPQSEKNNMFATYDEPFSVQLGDDPWYVHVQSQDAAGNVEDYVSLELPTLADLTLSAEATPRCMAGNAAVYVSVTNEADAASSAVTVQTGWGTGTVDPIGSGETASVAVNSRESALDAGTLTISSAGGEDTFERAVSFPAVDCG